MVAHETARVHVQDSDSFSLVVWSGGTTGGPPGIVTATTTWYAYCPRHAVHR